MCYGKKLKIDSLKSINSVLDSCWLEMTRASPMHGSWIFCQTERLWSAFLRPNILSKLIKITVTCQKYVKINQFWLVQSQQNDHPFWTAQSYLKAMEKLETPDSNRQTSLIQRVPFGTPPHDVVTSLTQSCDMANLFIISYRGTTVIKITQ